VKRILSIALIAIGLAACGHTEKTSSDSTGNPAADRIFDVFFSRTADEQRQLCDRVANEGASGVVAGVTEIAAADKAASALALTVLCKP
jgi:hypothetical protein